MQKPGLLDQVRHVIRIKHYSIQTEEAYVSWVLRYILFHKKRHPLEMGVNEVGLFLTHPAVNAKLRLQLKTRPNVLLFFCIKRY